MSRKVNFSIPDDVFNHLRSYLNQFNFRNVSVGDFLKALAINRAIEKDILNEFGMPNELVIFPKIDFDSISPQNPFGVGNNVRK